MNVYNTSMNGKEEFFRHFEEVMGRPPTDSMRNPVSYWRAKERPHTEPENRHDNRIVNYNDADGRPLAVGFSNGMGGEDMYVAEEPDYSEFSPGFQRAMSVKAASARRAGYAGQKTTTGVYNSDGKPVAQSSLWTVLGRLLGR